MSTPSKRIKGAIESMGPKRISNTRRRSNFREEFMARLKNVRNQEIDKFRRICEDNLNADYESLVQLKKLLEPSKEAVEIMNITEVMELLQKVELEILQLEGEQRQAEEEREINTIVNNLMQPCKLCNSLIITGDLCDACCEQITTPF